jgi:hypothetical protein
MPRDLDKPYASRYTNADWAEQQKICYQLRLQHYTIRQIAGITGLSIGTVHKRIADEIAETVAPFREQYVAMARERLDNTSRLVLDLLERRHYLISEGHVVRMDGTPIEDDEFVLKCVDRLLNIEKQRSGVEGTNAPLKVDANVNVTETTQEDLELADMIRTAQAKAAAAESQLKENADG